MKLINIVEYEIGFNRLFYLRCYIKHRTMKGALLYVNIVNIRKKSTKVQELTNLTYALEDIIGTLNHENSL